MDLGCGVALMKNFSCLVYLGGILVVGGIATPLPLGAQPPAAPAPPTPEQLTFFEKSIRPVLVRECYSCHATTAPKVRGGLTLDTREGLRKGGDSGPAIIPGDVKKSLLLQALRQEREELKMPPKKKLPDEVLADFEKWVAMG